MKFVMICVPDPAGAGANRWVLTTEHSWGEAPESIGRRAEITLKQANRRPNSHRDRQTSIHRGRARGQGGKCEVLTRVITKLVGQKQAGLTTWYLSEGEGLRMLHVKTKNNLVTGEGETGASVMAGSDQEQVSCLNEVGVDKEKERETGVSGKVLTD